MADYPDDLVQSVDELAVDAQYTLHQEPAEPDPREMLPNAEPWRFPGVLVTFKGTYPGGAWFESIEEPESRLQFIEVESGRMRSFPPGDLNNTFWLREGEGGDIET